MVERPQRQQQAHRWFRDPAAGEHSRPPCSSGNSPGNGGNVDTVLFKNLVEMVPLVESLMQDRRADSSSFTRRASMIYTPMPSNHHKLIDQRGRKASQTVSAKKRRDLSENKHVDNGEEFSVITSNLLATETIGKDNEELSSLREQMDDMNKKLMEKDKAIKSAEEAANQLTAVRATIEELKRQIANKDAMIRSFNSHLSNEKIKLADKQAALEKLEWEAKTSNSKVEELKEYVDSMNFEVSSLMRIFEELSKSDASNYSEENVTYFPNLDNLPKIESINENEMERIEEARAAYMAAVAALKQNPTDELIAAAAEARRMLQAFVF